MGARRAHLITGTGTGQPSGVVTGASVGVTGGTTTGFGAQGTADQGTDLLHDLHGSLAEPYALQSSRAWVMGNATLTKLRKLKTTDGVPAIVTYGFLGAPFVVDPNVAAIGSSAKSIVYGDWSRYFVRIAEGIRIERSDDYAFNTDLVTFRALIRLDAELVDTNAIVVLQHPAV